MRRVTNKVIKAELFDSVTEFIGYLDKTPDNNTFAKRRTMKPHGSESGSYSSTLTDSFADANEIMRNGYPEGLKSMLETKGGIKESPRPRRYDENNVCGYRVNVPRAIQGLPTCMVRRVTTYPKSNVIKLYYDMSANCCVGGNTIALGGKNLMTLIRHYESRNCKVELNMLIAIAIQDRVAVMAVKVKDLSQKLNPLLISYSVTHPSFFRRHGFRWVEISPCTDYAPFAKGYGHCLNEDRYVRKDMSMQDYLRKNNVIPKDGYYLSLNQVAYAKSLEEITNNIN